MPQAVVRKLGDRLRRSRSPDPADLELLQQLRAEYDPPLQEVERTLRELGLLPTSRLKTATTIVAKLIRDKPRLHTIEDIAGARIVEDITLLEQDERVARICGAFEQTRVKDRRAEPSHGY